MAIDTATKRFSALGVPLGLGVTPDATPDKYWRASAGWWYSIGETAVSLILDMPMQDDAATFAVVNLVDNGFDQPFMEGGELTEDASVAGPGGQLAKALYCHVSGGHGSTPDYVYTGFTYALDWTAGGSFQWWSKRDADNAADQVCGSNQDPFNPRIYFAADGTLHVVDLASNDATISLAGVDTTLWHHYAVTKVAGTLTLFVDGATHGTFTGTLSDQQQVGAVGHNDVDAFSNMAVCGVRMYDANRTQANIQSDYSLGVGSGSPSGALPGGLSASLPAGLSAIDSRIITLIGA